MTRSGSEPPECAARIDALDSIAMLLADRAQRGAPLPQTAEMTFELRRRGVPHVRPHGWALSGAGWNAGDTQQRFASWVESLHGHLGWRLCGFAETRSAEGVPSVAAVAVDAVADLSPVPTQARLGRWISIDAAFLVDAVQAKVVATGPTGSPKPVPTQFAPGRAHATLSVDQVGEWTIQVLADLPTGPRPVLEAKVFVEQRPSEAFAREIAPGETAAGDGPDPTDRLERMIGAARAAWGLPALARVAELDAIANVHAESMRDRRLLAHDVGLGTLEDRLNAAGLAPHTAGENVAHATTPERAHRTIWASPSHRDNLLFSRFDSIGIGAAVDPDGTVWVCEIFGYFGPAGKGEARHPGQSVKTTE